MAMGIILRGVYLKECEPLDEDGNGDHVITVEDYLDSVKSSFFTDYDGYGHPVKDNKQDTQLDIIPSEGRNHIPLDATHIVWFNK